jgi:hypothetical protein
VAGAEAHFRARPQNQRRPLLTSTDPRLYCCTTRAPHDTVRTIVALMTPARFQIVYLGHDLSVGKELAALLEGVGYQVTVEPDGARRPIADAKGSHPLPAGADGSRSPAALAARRTGKRPAGAAAPVVVLTARRAPRGKHPVPGMNLRELRESIGKTQVEIARRASMSQPQLSRFEGRHDHLISTLRAYVRSLGGEIDVVARIGRKRVFLRDV